MTIHNEKGAALIFSLLILTVLIGFSTVFVIRTVQESRSVQIENNSIKAFYAAEGATAQALNSFYDYVNTTMSDRIGGMTPSAVENNVESYITASNEVGFFGWAINDPSATDIFTVNSTTAVHTNNNIVSGDGESYSITIWEKPGTTASEVSQNLWEFYYNYRIDSTGSSDNVSRDMSVSGDFTVTVENDNFAKYALFTSSQGNIWFTSNTNFTGPIHTNGRFNIYQFPTFDGAVSQVENTTRYYNGGWPNSTVYLDADDNAPHDIPTFNNGFTRGADTISLPASGDSDDLQDQATATTSYGSSGIYLTNSSGALDGGIYVNGNGTVDMSVVSGNAVYDIVSGSDHKIITVNRGTNETTVEDVNASTTTTYSGLPDGEDDVGTLIFFNGSITDIGGTVQQDTGVTIVSTNDMIIQDHIQYEGYTAAVSSPGQPDYAAPHANGYDNTLGLVSWNGNIRIGSSAPNDLNIHGTVMTRSGSLQVDNYSSGSHRGTVTILGGVIQDAYGPFGTFGGGGGTGYGRNFVYDERMMTGSPPPYFPSLSTFVTNTGDLTDNLIWQEG